MIKRNKLNFDVIVKIILAGFLLLCLADMPYGYYKFVGFSALTGFVFLAYKAYNNRRQTEMFIFGALAILFQPLVKISLGREMWNILDVVVAVGLLISIWVDRKR